MKKGKQLFYTTFKKLTKGHADPAFAGSPDGTGSCLSVAMI